jgi:hypothetical protein
MSEKQSRRDAIKTTAAASLGVASGAFAIPRGKRNLNIFGKDFIREENSKKGTRDWRLSKTKTVPGKINKILGQRTLQSDRRLLQRKQPAGGRKA